MNLTTLLALLIPSGVRRELISAYEKNIGSVIGWNWPGYSPGQGDKGPPGTWQMANLNGQSSDAFMAFSAVYACVRIISEDIAKLPIAFYDVNAKGDRSLNRTYPANKLMRKPNSYQNRLQFIESFVASYLLTGNTYVLKRYDARNLIREMHVLDPRKVQLYMTMGGDIFYRVAQSPLAGIAESVMIPQRDIIHHRLLFSPSYPLTGVTPIYAAAASSITGQAIISNSQAFFQNGGRPGGILTSPGKISEALAKRLKEDWDNNYGSGRTGKTAVLGEGLEFKAISMSYVDAQLIEQLRMTIEDVGRAFRVPIFMIGDLTKSNFKTVESITRTYINGCLSYHIEALEASFDEAFEFDGTMETEFDLDAILTAEIDVRYEAYSKALSSGFKSINDVRRLEGDTPIENGDEPLVQAQMRPLSLIAEMETLDSGGQSPSPDPNAPDPNAPEPEPPDDTQEDQFNPDRVRALIKARLGGGDEA